MCVYIFYIISLSYYIYCIAQSIVLYIKVLKTSVSWIEFALIHVSLTPDRTAGQG